MSLLASWTQRSHSADGYTHDTYRKGSGPGVIVIHEVPGLHPSVIEFGEELVEAGYTVLMPSLFGRAEAPYSAWSMVKALPRICISRELTLLATGKTAPLAGWLRSLARELHADVGGPGVGALGMCLTGGFALAMMVDPAVIAPVLCQPSAPLPLGDARAGDVNLSPSDVVAVRERTRSGCAVLGLHFAEDPLVGTRFETLRRGLGPSFREVPLPGKGHSTVTEQRSQVAVDAILAFFAERLRGG
ncbi:MAG TPA: dienelactone hydrolase family protein [Candidatus Lustribacter sp.]|nr:dienelactone hydrolase family protein [Candidatus Lustribacter sp.]